MATGLKLFLATHPGIAANLADIHGNSEHASLAMNPTAFMAALEAGHMFSKDTFTRIGGGHTYLAAGWTVTTTGTSAAAAQATTAGGGVKLTCGSDSTFNTNLQSIQPWTPVADKWVLAHCRVQASDITTVGWEFNIGASAVDPATTNYTDVFGLKMAVGAGTVLGKVRGNSGTQVTSSTLYTMAATTDAYFGLLFKLSATEANNAGCFFYGSNIMNITGITDVSAITGAKAQMAAILTSPPSMYMNLHAKGSAGNPTITFTSAFGQVDN